ncbi:MAG: peptidylprolyl isomerase [Pseudomonadota bacterium]
MKKLALIAPVAFGFVAAFTLPFAAAAQTETQPSQPPVSEAPPQAPGPGDIINAAPATDWTAIAAEDLLVMTLAPQPDGTPREVIIQLMPKPFSHGWTHNMRALARANWYDGISVNRVQDNYVVQWGDPNYDNPESGGKAKALPDDLKTMPEGDYVSVQFGWDGISEVSDLVSRGAILLNAKGASGPLAQTSASKSWDIYAEYAGFVDGWPVGFGNAYTASPGELVVREDVAKKLIRSLEGDEAVFGALAGDEQLAARRIASSSLTAVWPVHCYGMVGVGRNYSPDTGSGAELYTVIGHGPRHLDRNIALVGRIISGMEHLSSLPRGTGALGFYTAAEADKRTPITSIRVASDLPQENRPQFEYLATDSSSFARYAHTRANRRDPFFIAPAGGADLCNITVPIRRIEEADE